MGSKKNDCYWKLHKYEGGKAMKKIINMINSSSKVTGLTLLELKKIEKELGAFFPSDYKDFYLESNGAEFGEWILYPLMIKEDSKLKTDIIKKNREYRPANLPDEMISIGENTKGDRLCFRLRKKFMQEQIYYWNSETGQINNKALSLTHFIDWFIPVNSSNTPKLVGRFMVESGTLIVTDPSYSIDEKNSRQVILSNVKKGEWKATVSYTEEDLVENLQVFYGENKSVNKWENYKDMIAVDSGQAGIFDISFFGKDSNIPFEMKNIYNIDINSPGSKYYVACADATATDLQGGVVPGGAVTTSGYGDGLYKVKVIYNTAQEIVGVKIVFI